MSATPKRTLGPQLKYWHASRRQDAGRKPRCPLTTDSVEKLAASAWRAGKHRRRFTSDRLKAEITSEPNENRAPRERSGVFQQNRPGADILSASSRAGRGPGARRRGMVGSRRRCSGSDQVPVIPPGAVSMTELSLCAGRRVRFWPRRTWSCSPGRSDRLLWPRALPLAVQSPPWRSRRFATMRPCKVLRPQASFPLVHTH